MFVSSGPVPTSPHGFLLLIDAKQQIVSHSTIEKQRRDRINSLIDELRELVPSAATLKGPDGGDMKRPKHVVLSDTISLLKRLQEKVCPCTIYVTSRPTYVHAAWQNHNVGVNTSC